MSDYKSTLNLHKTGFPMRANLANREPNMLKIGMRKIFTKLLERRKRVKKP